MAQDLMDLLGIGGASATGTAGQAPPPAPVPPTPQTAPGETAPLWAMIAAAIGDALQARTGGPGRALPSIMVQQSMNRDRDQRRLDQEFIVKNRQFEREQDIGREDEVEARRRAEREADIAGQRQFQEGLVGRQESFAASQAELDRNARKEEMDRLDARHAAELAANRERYGDRGAEKRDDEQRAILADVRPRLMESVPRDIAAVAAGEKTVAQLRKEWNATLDMVGLEGSYRERAEDLLERHLFAELKEPTRQRPTGVAAQAELGDRVFPGLGGPLAGVGMASDLLRGLFGEQVPSGDVRPDIPQRPGR